MSVATPPPPPRYAGFRVRLLATLVDTLLLTLLLLPPLILVWGPRLQSPEPALRALVQAGSNPAALPDASTLAAALLAGGTPSPLGLWGDLLVGWVLPALLVVLFWHRWRGTPGKLWLSLAIVDARSGRAPSLRQSLLRYLGYFLSSLPFGLGFLWVVWDRRKQGWHDKLAGTVVIRLGNR